MSQCEVWHPSAKAVALDFSRSLLFPIALLAALPFGPLAEEIGWRGYAQPRLLERVSPLSTGLLLGAIWFVWHIPLFFAPAGTSVSGGPITPTGLLLYLGLLTGMSILIVWFSQWTGAGLLSGLLIHLGMNAEIYRLFFDLETDQLTRIEHWSVLPIWLLIIGLVISGWGRETKQGGPGTQK
jgi:membrane protease YdiL (CAAX protease family)